MRKQLTLASLFTASLTVSFIIFMGAVVVFGAWSDPSQAPPLGNIDAPLNVGNDGQVKAGGLVLNTGGAENGLIVMSGKTVLNGALNILGALYISSGAPAKGKWLISNDNEGKSNWQYPTIGEGYSGGYGIDTKIDANQQPGPGQQYVVSKDMGVHKFCALSKVQFHIGSGQITNNPECSVDSLGDPSGFRSWQIHLKVHETQGLPSQCFATCFD